MTFDPKAAPLAAALAIAVSFACSPKDAALNADGEGGNPMTEIADIPALSGSHERAVIAYCDYQYSGVPSTDPLLLAESVRAFGASLSDVEIWMLHPATKRPTDEVRARAAALRVSLIPYETDASVARYPFAAKALAAAEAERIADGATRRLVWFDRDSVVLGDLAPLLGEAGKPFAYRPVNMRNVGIPWNAEPDEYWMRIFSHAGADMGESEKIRSSIDDRELKLYVMAGLVSVDPSRGTLREWARVEKACAADAELAEIMAKNGKRSLFMHQVALTAAVVATTDPSERLLLPPSVSYPISLYSSDDESRRPGALDALVSIRYDQAFEDVGWKSLPMSDSLKAWLEERLR
jgi:hypothetical protein